MTYLSGVPSEMGRLSGWFPSNPFGLPWISLPDIVSFFGTRVFSPLRYYQSIRPNSGVRLLWLIVLKENEAVDVLPDSSRRRMSL